MTNITEIRRRYHEAAAQRAHVIFAMAEARELAEAALDTLEPEQRERAATDLTNVINRHCRIGSVIPHAFISSADILRRYGITRKTLSNWRKLRGFPNPVGLTRKGYYKLSEVQNWEALTRHRFGV